MITKHYALGMSGMAIAKSLNASPSGVNDFLRAFKECRSLGYGYNYLAPFISDALNLYELNALSRKLADLNPAQQTAFAGLLKMEIEKRDGDILVPKLIDLAYSVDCCHVVAEALNDSQLGRFYADNGFIPITENVPDSVYELLDFEALGRKARNEEGGVFVDRDTYGCFGYAWRGALSVN